MSLNYLAVVANSKLKIENASESEKILYSSMDQEVFVIL